MKRKMKDWFSKELGRSRIFSYLLFLFGSAVHKLANPWKKISNGGKKEEKEEETAKAYSSTLALWLKYQCASAESASLAYDLPVD
jgi:hypothetical protein